VNEDEVGSHAERVSRYTSSLLQPAAGNACSKVPGFRLCKEAPASAAGKKSAGGSHHFWVACCRMPESHEAVGASDVSWNQNDVSQRAALRLPRKCRGTDKMALNELSPKIIRHLPAMLPGTRALIGTSGLLCLRDCASVGACACTGKLDPGQVPKGRYPRAWHLCTVEGRHAKG